VDVKLDDDGTEANFGFEEQPTPATANVRSRVPGRELFRCRQNMCAVCEIPSRVGKAVHAF
jgi:hypothetical protein